MLCISKYSSTLFIQATLCFSSPPNLGNFSYNLIGYPNTSWVGRGCGWLTLKIGKPLGNMCVFMLVVFVGLGCWGWVVEVLEEMGCWGVVFVRFVWGEDSLSLTHFSIIIISRVICSCNILWCSSVTPICLLFMLWFISFFMSILIFFLRLFINSCLRYSFFLLISSLHSSWFLSIFSSSFLLFCLHSL